MPQMSGLHPSHADAVNTSQVLMQDAGTDKVHQSCSEHTLEKVYRMTQI
jgi:hypothetical protein